MHWFCEMLLSINLHYKIYLDGEIMRAWQPDVCRSHRIACDRRFRQPYEVAAEIGLHYLPGLCFVAGKGLWRVASPAVESLEWMLMHVSD